MALRRHLAMSALSPLLEHERLRTGILARGITLPVVCGDYSNFLFKCEGDHSGGAALALASAPNRSHVDGGDHANQHYGMGHWYSSCPCDHQLLRPHGRSRTTADPRQPARTTAV